MRIKLTNLAVLFFALVMLSANTKLAFSDEKSDITQAWHRYFQSLHSLKFEYRTVMQIHPLKEEVGNEWKFKFALNGSKFRNDQQLPKSDDGTASTIDAYNGTYYQSLSVEPKGVVQLVYSRTLHTDLPYGGSLPVLSAFYFVFRKTDVYSVETLQQPGIWNALARRITKIEKASEQGRRGRILTIKGRGNDEFYQVFVEDGTLFPWSYKRAVTKTEAKTGQQYRESTESRVTKAQKWQVGNTISLFPLSVGRKLLQDGKLFIASFDEVAPETLEINRPIKDEIFTIPKSQATILVDIDAQQKRMEKAKQ